MPDALFRLHRTVTVKHRPSGATVHWPPGTRVACRSTGVVTRPWAVADLGGGILETFKLHGDMERWLTGHANPIDAGVGVVID